MESATRGAVKGLTLGFADEIGAAELTAFDTLKGLLGKSQVELNQEVLEELNRTDNLKKEAGREVPVASGDIGPTSIGEFYKDERDIAREYYDKVQEANPMSFLGGEIAGALALPLGELAGATKAGKALAGSKNLDKLGKVGKSMAVAAPKVGLETAAYSAGQVEEAKDIPKAIGKGFVTGAATGASLPLAGKVYQQIKEGAKGAGKQLMKYASEIDPRIIDDVFKNPTLLKNPRKVTELTDELKESAIELKDSAERIAREAKDFLSGDEVYQTTDISNLIKKRALDVKKSPSKAPAFKALESFANHIDTNYAGNMSQRQVQELLDELSNMAYKGVKKDAPGAVADQLRAVRGELSDILKQANPEYRKAMSEAERSYEALNKVKSKFGIEDVTNKTFNEFGEVTDVSRGLDFKGAQGKDTAMNKLRGIGKPNKEAIEDFLKDPEIQKYLKLGEDFIQEGRAAQYLEELEGAGASTKVLTGLKAVLGAQFLGPVAGAAAILAPSAGRQLVQSPKAIMATKGIGTGADKVATKFGETFSRPISTVASSGRVSESVDRESTMKHDSAKLESSSPDELVELSGTFSQFGKAGEGYSRVLQKASEQDESDRKRTLFGLQQQPAFRELLKRIEDEK